MQHSKSCYGFGPLIVHFAGFLTVRGRSKLNKVNMWNNHYI